MFCVRCGNKLDATGACSVCGFRPAGAAQHQQGAPMKPPVYANNQNPGYSANQNHPGAPMMPPGHMGIQNPPGAL